MPIENELFTQVCKMYRDGLKEFRELQKEAREMSSDPHDDKATLTYDAYNHKLIKISLLWDKVRHQESYIQGLYDVREMFFKKGICE